MWWVSRKFLSTPPFETGVLYQTLTEETRCDLAIGFFRDGRQSLAEIAFLTVSAVQSSFNRALKLALGQTLASDRKGRAGL